MRTRLPAILILLTVSASVIGCAGKTKFPSYYTLHVAPPPILPSRGGRELRSRCTSSGHRLTSDKEPLFTDRRQNKSGFTIISAGRLTRARS